jgi:hypothetical protein
MGGSQVVVTLKHRVMLGQLSQMCCATIVLVIVMVVRLKLEIEKVIVLVMVT